MSRVDPVRTQLNASFEKRPPPSLQTPKPTQPYNNGMYQHLLNIQDGPGRPYSPHSNSTNPSPSSTLCSSSTLALRDEDVRKFFMSPHLAPKLPPSMNAVVYAHPFPPIDLTSESERKYSDNTSLPVKPSRNHDERKPMQPPPPPLRIASYVHSTKSWSAFFNDGCRIHNVEVSSQYAQNIVRHGRWQQDEMLDLVRAFIWRASNAEAETNDALAAFAVKVQDAFYILAPQAGLHYQFALHLRNAAIGTFVSCWHVGDSRKAILFDEQPSPTYRSYVTSALCLCNFIGDLYANNFVSRIDTIGCIRIILHNLALVEHLTAIDNILHHAGSRLWSEALDLEGEVKEFKEQLRKAGKIVQDHKFVTERPVQGAVKKKVSALIRYVEECKMFVLQGTYDARRAIDL